MLRMIGVNNRIDPRAMPDPETLAKRIDRGWLEPTGSADASSGMHDSVTDLGGGTLATWSLVDESVLRCIILPVCL